MPLTRLHLASLINDFRAKASETAVVAHRGIRSHRTTYGELARLAGRFAAELDRRGIGHGERVLLWGENSAAWIAAFFGCLLRGVLVVPLDAQGAPEFARRVLADVAPSLVVADPGRLLLVGDVMKELAVPSVVLTGLEEQLPSEPEYRVDPAVDLDTPFQIIFTSGTTSEPKGIVHTHRNVLASLSPIETEIAKYGRYEQVFHPLRFLHTLPLSHVFGQFMGLWIPGVLGAELHFSDALDASRVVALIQRQRISVLVAVPRVLALLRAYLLGEFPALTGELDAATALSVLKRSWRFRAVRRRFGWKFWAVISGGASLSADLEQFWNRLGIALVQGYGMTETAALITLNHPFHVGHGTIGKALPGREVRLSNTGELLVRGDMVSGTTWQGGRLTRRESEWLATGDLAEQNETGEYRFVGRKGDAIVTSSGLNIHPADLEAAMLRQPGMQSCAVVPCDMPHGPEPVCVVIFHGGDLALDKAVRTANGDLAEFQQMRRVLRWPEVAFPYTSTGKLLRRRIREWACLLLASEGGAMNAASTGDILLEALESVTGEPVPSQESNALRLAEDLHLDSLGRVQLASAVEQRTGVLLSDTAMTSLVTLGDLRQAITASLALTGSADPATSIAGELSVPVSRQHLPKISATDQKHGQGADAATLARGGSANRKLPGDAAAKAVYPRWPWLLPIRWLRFIFLEAVVRPLLAMLLAPRVTLTAPIPSGPLLLVANHLTMLDAALVLYALPQRLRRHVAVMMSGELLGDFRSGRRSGIAGRAAYFLITALFNVFPLPQLQGFRQSFAHAGEALDRGMSVLIFPEGGRSKTGAMAPFRSGIGLLASQAGVPVQPVALVGLNRIRGKGARWFRTGILRVEIGEAILWNGERSAECWTAELESRLRAMLQEAASPAKDN